MGVTMLHSVPQPARRHSPTCVTMPTAEECSNITDSHCSAHCMLPRLEQLLLQSSKALQSVSALQRARMVAHELQMQPRP